MGDGGGWWGYSVSFSILSVFLSLQARVYPDPVPMEEEGFPGYPTQPFGDAVADDVATLGSTGECTLSADTLSVANCTLGTCSLSVGDAFCGSSYDLMEVNEKVLSVKIHKQV